MVHVWSLDEQNSSLCLHTTLFKDSKKHTQMACYHRVSFKSKVQEQAHCRGACVPEGSVFKRQVTSWASFKRPGRRRAGCYGTVWVLSCFN